MKRTPRNWRLQVQDAEGNSIRHNGTSFFDELMVADLLHIESLDDEIWCLQVGDAQLTVSVLDDGRVKVDIVRGANDEILGDTDVWSET